MEIDNKINDKEIIDNMRKLNLFSGVHRKSYAINEEKCIEVVKIIGSQIVHNFVIDDDNLWAYYQLIRWLFGSEDMLAMNPMVEGDVVRGRLDAGIYLAGGTGTGKSVALRIMRILARLYDVRIRIGSEERCIFWSDYNASEMCMGFGRTGDLSKYVDNQILCIQDFGSEPKEVAYMGTKVNPMRQIIERRADAGSNITLFSSNLPMRDSVISNLYGDRVYSRLVPMCNYIVMKGKDRRRIYG